MTQEGYFLVGRPVHYLPLGKDARTLAIGWDKRRFRAVEEEGAAERWRARVARRGVTVAEGGGRRAGGTMAARTPYLLSRFPATPADYAPPSSTQPVNGP